MARDIVGQRKGWCHFAVAMSVGLALGVVIGAWVMGATRSFDMPVDATATHGQDNYAMATGLLEPDVELVVFFNGLTADLKAAALNVRTQKFQVFYSRNIRSDFTQKSGKNPRFLMTTGRAEFNSQAGKRLGQSVVYITEVSSGECIAYGVQGFQNRKTQSRSIQGILVPLDNIVFTQARLLPETLGKTN